MRRFYKEDELDPNVTFGLRRKDDIDSIKRLIHLAFSVNEKEKYFIEKYINKKGMPVDVREIKYIFSLKNKAKTMAVLYEIYVNKKRETLFIEQLPTSFSPDDTPTAIACYF